MIFTDSSVWINQLRGIDTRSVNTLNAVQKTHSTILLGDLVLLEVLQGARNEAHSLQLETRLRKFKIESLLDDALAVKAARNYRLLRSRGITVRKTIDLIIATFCIERGHTLLHDDRDFDLLVDHLGLRAI